MYHYVILVTYDLPVSKIWTTSLNCEEAIKKPAIARLVVAASLIDAKIQLLHSITSSITEER
jgi:hypothetical protein